ncbi:hypothetical protein K491DRAFT_758123 [Lophiostoma macrostomum CBS 122681]|uniref:Uncharacterized protein n=1 Tax=Lophiostoma macrostomum CBS 122681 TaxID=1314788 RepID=A0A6A6T8I2_9PLEO|nr:hypothetical protein K491DRAFT_758123 [Lophiostoma macrostomum CBS 122681]
MCQVLYQVMGCGHSRAMCLNACPLARGPSYPNPFQDPHQSPASARPVSRMISKGDASPPARLGSGFLRPPHPYTQLPSYDTAVDYCFTFRPVRASQPSRFPCLKCYNRPEFEAFRKRWVNEYRVTHPNTNPDLLGELSGVAQIPERVGLTDSEAAESTRKERSRSVQDGVQVIEFERVLPEGFERWSMEDRKKLLKATPEVKVLRWDEVDLLE